MYVPKEAVKYFVLNHAKVLGLSSAIPAKSTVHNGNKVVNVSVVFKYVFQAFSLNDGFKETGTSLAVAVSGNVLQIDFLCKIFCMPHRA